MRNKLPNFLIVGAAKSGTSSLHNYLNQHPDVFMPAYSKGGVKVKEPKFLIKDLVSERLNGIWTLEEYQALFSEVKSEKLIGESTVFYLYYYQEAIKNIKHYLGDNVKIIIMLRNPTDRAYSAFHHVARGPQENLSFEEALAIEEGRLKKDKYLTPMVMYKAMGMYYNMVKSYQDAFKDVHVVFHEDFRDNTGSELDKIYDFLEISNNVSIDFRTKHNVGGKKWKTNKLKKIFVKNTFLKSCFQFIVTKKFKDWLYIKIMKISTTKVPEMEKETRIFLNNYFKQDVQKLSKLLNRDLSNWQVVESLPNLFIVGAAKSGTTSLHNYLNQHQDIFMCTPKEPHFLVNNDIGKYRMPNGISSEEKYLDLFSAGKDKKYRGESSVMYLMFPEIVIPKIIQKFGDDCKIIIILRNPVERAYSGFQHVKRYNIKENMQDFRSAWDISEERYFEQPDITPASRYKELGMYSKQVKAYLDGMKNVHIMFYDDYKNDFQLEMKKVFDFLELDNMRIDSNIRHMVGGWQWKNTALKNLIRKKSPLRSLLNVIIPSKSLKKWIRSKVVSYSIAKVPQMKIEDREMLKLFYKDDIQKLSRLLGRDLKGWLE